MVEGYLGTDAILFYLLAVAGTGRIAINSTTKKNPSELLAVHNILYSAFASPEKGRYQVFFCPIEKLYLQSFTLKIKKMVDKREKN